MTCAVSDADDSTSMWSRSHDDHMEITLMNISNAAQTNSTRTHAHKHPHAHARAQTCIHSYTYSYHAYKQFLSKAARIDAEVVISSTSAKTHPWQGSTWVRVCMMKGAQRQFRQVLVVRPRQKGGSQEQTKQFELCRNSAPSVHLWHQREYSAAFKYAFLCTENCQNAHVRKHRVHIARAHLKAKTIDIHNTRYFKFKPQSCMNEKQCSMVNLDWLLCAVQHK